MAEHHIDVTLPDDVAELRIAITDEPARWNGVHGRVVVEVKVLGAELWQPVDDLPGGWLRAWTDGRTEEESGLRIHVTPRK